jgi:hypothetical protein
MVNCYQKNLNTMSLYLYDKCAARSRRSRALVIRVSKHVLVESGMPYLYSCATRVVPEFGKEIGRKPPR